jgi:hypothetical protein
LLGRTEKNYDNPEAGYAEFRTLELQKMKQSCLLLG